MIQLVKVEPIVKYGAYISGGNRLYKCLKCGHKFGVAKNKKEVICWYCGNKK